MHARNYGTAPLALTLTGAISFGVLACGGGPKTVRIAVAGPLSGPSAHYGNEQLEGARVAVTQANAAGGVLGRQVEMVIVDDKGDVKKGGEAALDLAQDYSILAVVGHPNSSVAMLASDVYDQYHIPFIATVATTPKLTQKGNTWTFRICPTDELQGPLAAELAYTNMGKKTFALLDDGSAYGIGAAEQFGRKVETLGGKVLTLEQIVPGKQDYRDELGKIAQLKPEVLYFAGLYPEAARIVKQARELGMQATFMAPDGAYDPGFLAEAGPAAEGSIVSFLAASWEQSPRAKAFDKAYTATHPRVDPLAPYGYDAINVVLAAIKRAGKLDRSAIRAALADPGFSFDGVTGPIAFDKDRQLKDGRFYFYRVEGGVFHPFEAPAPPATPPTKP